jgi:iron complex outermembrane receptor protein
MSQVGLLLQDQIKFDARWVGVVGIRHDRVKTDSVATTPTDPDAVTKPRDSATSKNLGLVYLADGGWSPYASYSESFEPVAPSSEQTFKPKRGKQVEAGVKWSPADTGITAAAAAYELKEKNRVMSAPTADNPNLQVQSGEVTVKGFELEAAANLRAWELVTSYTYMDAQQTAVGNDVKYLGQQLSGIPKHSAAVWATHKFGAYGLPGFKAGLGVRYAGETTDGTGNNTVPSVTLLDLLLAYDRGPWRLAFNVSNLTDKTYIATCLERGDCWFGNERKAVLSVAYRW